MFYLLRNQPTHWGSWSDILWAGFVPLDDDTDEYYIERSGPFTPHMYESCGSLILTDKAKLAYEASSLQGMSFSQPLEKRKIVNMDWTSWDKEKEYYDYIEDIIEPAEIIDLYPHDPDLARVMPEYWRADISNGIHMTIDRNMKRPKLYEYLSIDKQQLANVDFFYGIEYLGFVISQNAKKWMEEYFPESFDIYQINVEQ